MAHDPRRKTGALPPSAVSGKAANRPSDVATAVTARAPVGFRLARLLTRSIGSLQLAILLLAGLVAILLLGTVVESRYDQRVAHELVYGTWWFVLFLALLAANVFFAAAKKWPWRRHQTGFLITHVGLLMLVGSGLITSLTGSHGLMLLIDSAELGDPIAVQTSNRVVNRRQDVVVVIDGDEEHAAMVSTGPFSWPSDRGQQPVWLAVLRWLRQPLSRPQILQLDSEVEVELLGYSAQTSQVPFRKSVATVGMAAVQLELRSPTTGVMPEIWCASDERFRRVPVGPSLVEFYGNGLDAEGREAFLQSKTMQEETPDSVRALLHLATGDDGVLLYRSFVKHPTEGWKWENAGVCSEGDTVRIWSGMQWRFRVKQFYPHAEYGPFVEPLDGDFFGEDPASPPAIHCRVRRRSDSQEVVLRRSDRQSSPITLAGRSLRIGYRPQMLELEFAVMLLRGEQKTDPGTSMPARQSSHVMIVDPAVSKEPIYRVISLNQPLSYGGFTFYQSSLQVVGRDSQGKPVRRSALVVTRDPGIRLKYAGATMVGLGIACMFYMKAYFFKPRQTKR